MKVMNPHQSVMDEHGPMFVIGAVLIVAGIQMLAIGLLGELQVRHYYTNQQRAPYTVDRLVRLRIPGRAEHAVGSDATAITKTSREQGFGKIEARAEQSARGFDSAALLRLSDSRTFYSDRLPVAVSLIPILSLAVAQPLRCILAPVMKAIQIHATGGPEVLELADLPIPVPGPGQVLIRIEATGVNFIEIYFRKGVYKAALPLIPGSEAAGTVEELGPGVNGIRTRATRWPR